MTWLSDTMPGESSDPNEPDSNRLAAFLRDCLLILIVLAMIATLVYFGLKGVITGHLYLSHKRWYRLADGLPAVLGGFALISLGGAFTSILLSHPRSRNRVPSWVLKSAGWFLAIAAILMIAALILSRGR